MNEDANYLSSSLFQTKRDRNDIAIDMSFYRYLIPLIVNATIS